MASTNNWLGFSLFPNHHHHQEISDGRGSTDEGCFDLTSAVPAAINLSAAPFGILEAFNRGNQAQDWNMKGSSELSMLIGSSCNAANHHEEPPKLENFLGSSQCFAENAATATPPPAYNHGGDHYNMFTDSSTTGSTNNNNNGGGDSHNNGFNVSLIKTWLGNQPAGPTTDHQSGGALSLSMMSNTGSHESAAALPLLTAATNGGGGAGGEIGEGSLSGGRDNKACHENGVDAASTGVATPNKKCIDTFGQRTSIYRGVTRHRWTGRYEAHLWDNSCRREGQTRKGRQVYLGGYDKEEKAARSYDLAAIKYWGTTTTTNFPISNYEKEVDEMKNMTRQEYIASLRRKSSGFSRGASIYRGVTRHHQQGRWQARIGRVAGNKDLYLGTFTTQEEAAEAYDIAAIKFRGLNAVTNFEINRYDVKSILESSTLPIGGAAKRLKDADALITSDVQQGSAAEEGSRLTSQLTANNHQYHHGMSSNFWPAAGISFQQAQALASVHGQHYGYGGHQRLLPWCKQESDCADTNGNHHHLLHTQNHGFHQDVNSQLQPGNGGHNYLYHYNLMGLDGPSLEQSSGSDPVMYGGGGENGNAVEYGSNGGGGGGYGLPMATTTVVGHAGNGTTGAGFGETDVNFYYQLSQQSSPNNGHAVKSAVGYDQSSAACNHWIPTAVPALASKTNNLPVCQGALPFTVWN